MPRRASIYLPWRRLVPGWVACTQCGNPLLECCFPLACPPPLSWVQMQRGATTMISSPSVTVAPIRFGPHTGKHGHSCERTCRGVSFTAPNPPFGLPPLPTMGPRAASHLGGHIPAPTHLPLPTAGRTALEVEADAEWTSLMLQASKALSQAHPHRYPFWHPHSGILLPPFLLRG